MKINLKALLQEQYLIPIKIIFVYILWKAFYFFASIPDTALHRFWLDFVARLGAVYAMAAGFILTICGMKAVSQGIIIHLVESGRQVLVLDHCLAIPAMVVFIGSVLFFRGRFKDKALFLLMGLSGIVLINLIRLILVSYAWVYLPAQVYIFHHSLLYVVIMYGFIFYMIASWMNRMVARMQSTGENQ